MRFVAVLNRDGGTLRTTDLAAFCERSRQRLESAGHSVECRIVRGKDILAALDDAAADDAFDVLMVGGGDGTVSAAASAMIDKDKALAIVPAGTMNLFARSLRIPLTIDDAVAAYADGEVRLVDMASANGRPFVHQFSIGMHAEMIQLRERMTFGSRIGKIMATARASLSIVRNPPALDVLLQMGGSELVTRTTALGVSNNLYGEGHLPYADRVDAGVLGIYLAVARERREIVRFLMNMARGRWRDNEQVEIHQADRVLVKVLSGGSNISCAIDGELYRLEDAITITMHPKALQVLVPAEADPATS